MNLFHDIGAGLSFLGVTVAAIKHVLSKRADAQVATAEAAATTSREEETTNRFRIKAKAHADERCLERVEALSTKVGALTSKLQNCEERHDITDGVVLRLKARLERLERSSDPAPAE